MESVGRTEEQVALQSHALKLAAVRCQDRELRRAAIERAARFRPVEAELDGIHATRAQREHGAADNDADHHSGHEAPFNDYQRDGDEREVVEGL